MIGRELLVAYLVLLAFLAAGDTVLHYLGLKQPALGVAGGVVLFIIALRMVFPDHEAAERRELDEEPFIVPLAVPMIAGPSALAAVLLLACLHSSFTSMAGSPWARHASLEDSVTESLPR
ncbi:MarC family protein [Thiocapsa sp.]|uniref:MarC family protein n=1 Tax=Thiocapsa sp. TaxID=2024551 RepID=UPI00261C1212|nr:MarC family protein [Thiocapsa sp.]